MKTSKTNNIVLNGKVQLPVAYASWSVSFGEQQRPSAAKWNILGTNDASFNDGTGIADAAVTPIKMAGAKLGGLGTLLAGSGATTSTAFMIQAGTAIGTTGYNTLTFPTAFPSGLVTFVAMNGDGDASSGVVYLKGGTVSRTSVQVGCSAAGTFRYDWLAIGW